MENRGYKSVEEIDYYGGRNVSDPGTNKTLNHKNLIIAAGFALSIIAVIVLLIVLLVHQNSAEDKTGMTPDENGKELHEKQDDVAEQFFEGFYSLSLNKNYMKQHYPNAVATLVWNDFQAFKDNEEYYLAADISFTALSTKKLPDRELAQYQGVIDEVLNDVEVTDGAYVKMKATYTDIDEIYFNVLVLTCNGKTGVWGMEEDDGNFYLIFE